MFSSSTFLEYSLTFSNIPLLDPGDVNELNENINMKISKEEILKCIKKLKNNKACGEDKVIINQRQKIKK
jgi:hypothetical protein